MVRRLFVLFVSLISAVYIPYAFPGIKFFKLKRWKREETEQPPCTGLQEYQDCIKFCQMNCSSFADVHCFEPGTCVAGCACPDGLTLDDNGDCIDISSCPSLCSYEGSYFPENFVLMRNVHKCICRKKQWECTPIGGEYGTCSVDRGTHYITFDGSSLSFQGNCTYVLAKSKPENPVQFQVLIQSAVCDSSDALCSNKVSVFIYIEELLGRNKDRLRLVYGKPPQTENFQYIVKEEGNRVTVTTDDSVGFGLHWINGTNVYVVLGRQHKGQVHGLCGNFNDDPTDDFITADGRLVDSPAQFAEAWRIIGKGCDATNMTKEITDSCKKNPSLKAWAVKACNIISSKVFKPCHEFLPFKPFREQ